jgi:hypothetical protein
MNNLSAAAEPSVELAEPGVSGLNSKTLPAKIFERIARHVREDGNEYLVVRC